MRRWITVWDLHHTDTPEEYLMNLEGGSDEELREEKDNLNGDENGY